MDEYGDFDNNDDYEDLPDYDYRIESLSIVEDGFSIDTLVRLLMPTCLLPNKVPSFSGSMEKLIFVNGNDSEVYSSEEIKFIEQINSVVMFQDFEKPISRSTMKCRLIAANILEQGHDALRQCLAFEKIANKALDGFNIYFFITDDCAYIGCRIFDKTASKDCIISNPIITDLQIEQIIDELPCIVGIDLFQEFYYQLQCLITSDRSDYLSYEDKYCKKNNMSFTYYEDLLIDGQTVRIQNPDSSYDKEYGFEKPELSFEELLAETEDYLSFIKSNRVNTYEILFEAEEMMQQALHAEEENARLSQQALQDHATSNYVEDKEISALIDDPEEMIRMMKRKRGIS